LGKPLDSVHVEKTTANDNGQISSWFYIPFHFKYRFFKINAWVFENSKEEMTYAGFAENDLGEKLSFPSTINI
jgi:hypothetical protein